MSDFHNLNINQTVQVSPNIILTQTIKPNIILTQTIKPKTIKKNIQTNHRISKSQLNDYHSSQNNQDTNSTNKQMLNPLKFNDDYFNKVHQNKLKIKSLLLNPKISKNKTNFSENIHKNLSSQNKAPFPQSYIQQIQQNLILIPKNQTHPQSSTKNQSYNLQSQYQTIVKYFLQKLQQKLTSNSNQRSKQYLIKTMNQRILWKLKQSQHFFTFDTISNQVTKIINQLYGNLFQNQQKILNFISFLLLSQNIQAYQVKLKDLQDSSQYSLDIICLTLNKNPKQKSQKVLSSFIEKNFLQFFTSQDIQKQNIQNRIHQENPFNNYQCHNEPTNLSAYLPSYEERNHFLLDKFSQTQNIFDDEQKLKLLLYLSRDPYEPRSSAKYISHMGSLVESMFGVKQQKGEGLKQSTSEKQLRQQESLQVEQELKAWQQTFGDLIVKF